MYQQAGTTNRAVKPSPVYLSLASLRTQPLVDIRLLVVTYHIWFRTTLNQTLVCDCAGKLSLP